MGIDVSDEVTKLRAEASEESLEKAAELERDQERELAKNASDEELAARRYDADDLRKQHRSASKRKAGAASKSSGSSKSKGKSG